MDIRELAISQNLHWSDPRARQARAYPARRDVFSTLLDGIRRQDGRARVLLGPRQVGKSTLLFQLADALLDDGWPPHAIFYFDFSDSRLLVEPRFATIRAVMGASARDSGPHVFLFDEVSHAAHWDRDLKQVVDSARRTGGARFVATDSASSILRGGGRESGVGRWDELRIESLSFSEFLRVAAAGGDPEQWLRMHPHELARYLEIGGFPEHATSAAESPAIHLRLREDTERALARDLGAPRLDVEKVLRLFVYLVQDSGAIFNAKKRGDDIEADRRTVGDWLRLLEDTQLVVRLEARTSSATARLKAKPRVYSADHGLINAFAPIAAPMSDPQVRGRVFESVVFHHLRSVARAHGGTVRYAREEGPRGQANEADFVLDLGDGCVVIEVTAAARIRSWKAAKARLGGARLEPLRRLVVHGGAETVQRETVCYVSVQDFLTAPSAHVLGGLA